MIAGGSVSPDSGFDVVTNFPVIQWIGLISYSLYLVHWPILTIAAEHSISPLSRGTEWELAGVSVVVAAVSYYLIERPVRNFSLLVRYRWLTYLMGAALIGLTYAVIFWHLHNQG